MVFWPSGCRSLRPEVHMFWTKRKYILLGGSLLLIAALAVTAASIRTKRATPATLPEETAIHVRLNQAVASDLNRPGDHFTATVSNRSFWTTRPLSREE